MKKYYKILGLEEGVSREEIEAAYIRLSKDLDPKENDNLDFFVEEYALVQDAYKKLTEKDDLVPETENDSSKSNKVPENIKDISKKIPKNFKGSKDLKPKEDSQSSNEKSTKSEKTNSNKQTNKSSNTNSSKPNKNNIPQNPKKRRGTKIFFTIIISFTLLYSISMFFYSKSILNEVEIYYEKALVRYDLNDFNMASKDIEIIDDLYEELNDLPFFLIGSDVFHNSFTLEGDISFAKLKYNSAILSYQKAISFNSDKSELFIKIGDVFIKKGDKTQALDYYKKGVKLFKNYDFKQKFTEFYDDQKYLLSIAICDIEINKNPRSFDGYFSKARAYNMNSDDKSAIRENSIALKIKPNSKYALYNHGLYHHNESKYTDAIEYFSKVIQIDPMYALAYSYRGSSNYFSKNYKKAVDDYRKAKSLDPNVYIYKTAFENSNKEYNKQISYNKIRAKNANKIKEYNKVKIGDYINGGIIFDKNYKNLEVKVMATSHSSKTETYGYSNRKVNDLYLNGYKDWVLPTVDEFNYISKNHKIINSKGPKSGKYFTKITNDRYWIKSGSSSRPRYMYGTSTAINTYTNSSLARSLPIRTFKF